METYIDEFHTSFYIVAIQKPEFNFSHVKILGTNHCGNTRREAFKNYISHQYVLCCRYHAGRVVTSFAHQIQSEYYGGNRYFLLK